MLKFSGLTASNIKLTCSSINPGWYLETNVFAKIESLIGEVDKIGVEIKCEWKGLM